jgi:hypothetical protein
MLNSREGRAVAIGALQEIIFVGYLFVTLVAAGAVELQL